MNGECPEARQTAQARGSGRSRRPDDARPGRANRVGRAYNGGIQRGVVILVAGAALLRALPAGAAPVVVDVTAGTAFPVDVGGAVTLEGPHRLLVSVGAGWMPKPYADSIDDTLRTFGAYDSDVSALIRAALKNSFVLQPSIGWRPLPRRGLEILAGYTLITLGGSLSGRQAIEAVTGRTFPSDAGTQIPLRSTLHNVHLQIDWRFLVHERWVLRIGVELRPLHRLVVEHRRHLAPPPRAGGHRADQHRDRSIPERDLHHLRLLAGPDGQRRLPVLNARQVRKVDNPAERTLARTAPRRRVQRQ